MYPGSSPGIQLEMSRKGAIVTPRMGKMFGCVKFLHMTASRQKVCEFR